MYSYRKSCPFIIYILLHYNIFAGNFGDAFLQIGTTPRAISLGQASVSIPMHPGGYLTNPAAIGNTIGASFHLMAVDQFSLANYYSAGLFKSLSDKWYGAINILSLQVSGIPVHPDLRTISSIEARRDSIRTLFQTGYESFSDNETALILSFTRSPRMMIDLGWRYNAFPIFVPIGMNVKVLHKKFYNLEGFGLGVDIGSMIRLNLSDVFPYDWLGEFSFGLAFNDILGTIIYWNTLHQDRIPPDYIRGVSYKQSFKILPVEILISLQSSSRHQDKPRQGLEISVMNRVAVRVGNDLGQLQGGIGVCIPFFQKTFMIDYCFTNHDLGDSHRIGGSVEF